MPEALPQSETAVPLLACDAPDLGLSGDGALRFKEADAVEIWIARWLRIPLKTLIARYGCDSRRLYEVWWGERFPASRAKAEAELRRRHPALADRISYGYRRIPRSAPALAAGQMGLFERT